MFSFESSTQSLWPKYRLPDVLSNWCFVAACHPANQTSLEELMLCVLQVFQAIPFAAVWLAMSGSSSTALCARNAHITLYDITSWSWVNLVNPHIECRTVECVLQKPSLVPRPSLAPVFDCLQRKQKTLWILPHDGSVCKCSTNCFAWLAKDKFNVVKWNRIPRFSHKYSDQDFIY